MIIALPKFRPGDPVPNNVLDRLVVPTPNKRARRNRAVFAKFEVVSEGTDTLEVTAGGPTFPVYKAEPMRGGMGAYVAGDTIVAIKNIIGRNGHETIEWMDLNIEGRANG